MHDPLGKASHIQYRKPTIQQQKQQRIRKMKERSSINSILAVIGLIVFVMGFAPKSYAIAILIDFDTLPGGGALPNNSVLTNQYSAVGAIFSGFENGGSVLQPTATTQFSGEFGGLPVSGQILENRDTSNNRADVVEISFLSSVFGIEFDFVPFGSQGPNTQFIAFDSLSNQIFNQAVGGPASTNVNFHYTGLSALSGVARLEIHQPRDNWVWGLDNLQYQQYNYL